MKADIDLTWFFQAILFLIIVVVVLFVIKAATKILNPKQSISIIKYLIKEMQQFFNKELTVGSLNFAGLIFIFIVGVLIVLGKEFGDLVAFVFNNLGKSQAKDLQETNDSLIIVLVLCFTTIASVYFVKGNEISIGKKTKKLKRVKKP